MRARESTLDALRPGATSKLHSRWLLKTPHCPYVETAQLLPPVVDTEGYYCWNFWQWSLENAASPFTCHNGFLEVCHSLLHGGLSQVGDWQNLDPIYPQIQDVREFLTVRNQDIFEVRNMPKANGWPKNLTNAQFIEVV